MEVTPCVGVWIETSMFVEISFNVRKVTPCVGVWIETICRSKSDKSEPVTPCVGVWIETLVANRTRYFIQSHPAWVCGLKQRAQILQSGVLSVTPCVGVWIETKWAVISEFATSSHPAWVCGLKL